MDEHCLDVWQVLQMLCGIANHASMMSVRRCTMHCMGDFKYHTSTKYWFCVSKVPGLEGEFVRAVGIGSMFSVVHYLVLLQ